MDHTFFLPAHNPWDMLGQPERSTNDAQAARRILQAALDLGWFIEEPIYLRPRWPDAGERVFHFLLRLPNREYPRLLTVRHSGEIERFVSQEGWQVENTTR